MSSWKKSSRRNGMDGERSNYRSNPNVLWDEAQSIIVLGINYHFECNSLELLSEKNKGIISVYSRNSDYHKIIKKKLKSLSIEISKLLIAVLNTLWIQHLLWKSLFL